jgi:hypothetical protein
MRRIFLTPLFLAVVFGPLTAFVSTVAWTRVEYRYEPGISQEEMRKWDQGKVAQLQAELAKRRVPYTRAQYLADSLGQRYFWKGLAKSSLIPTAGVFLACVCVGALERRQANRSSAMRA